MIPSPCLPTDSGGTSLDSATTCVSSNESLNDKLEPSPFHIVIAVLQNSVSLSSECHIGPIRRGESMFHDDLPWRLGLCACLT